MDIQALRETVDLPRVPVEVTNLNGDRDTTAFRRYIRDVPSMDTERIRLLLARIRHMTPEDWKGLTYSEQRGVYMLIRVFRDELLTRSAWVPM